MKRAGIFSDPDALIRHLKASGLAAQCPKCRTSFSFSESVLFDGRKKFPQEAEAKKQEMQQELDDRLAGLQSKKTQAAAGSEKKAIEVGFGKIIEKVLPTYRNFGMALPDCRFLAEPIDMIIFEGASKMDIRRIRFMEIKTGSSSLNAHQKQIRDAVRDERVRYEAV